MFLAAKIQLFNRNRQKFFKISPQSTKKTVHHTRNGGMHGFYRVLI